MNIQTIIPILLAALIVLVAAVILVFVILRIRSQRLKRKFGPEYDYTVQKLGDRRQAEADLKEREKRVVKLDIHPLGDEVNKKYHDEWISIQAKFVDNPSDSVEQANRLVTEVMIARGFPVADFEQRSADLSVIFPNLVPGYREAQQILMKQRNGGASTEELRQALLNFHTLFDELVSINHQTEATMEVTNESK
jgi:hypothetical protein